MQRFARVENGIVVEIVSLDDKLKLKDAYHPSIVEQMRPCGGNVEHGWRLSGSTFAPPKEPKATTDELRSHANWRRFAREIAGVEWNGMTLPTDRERRTSLLQARDMLRDGDIPGPTIDVVLGEHRIAAKKADLTAMAKAIGAHVQAGFAILARTLDKIDSGEITTRAGVDAEFDN